MSTATVAMAAAKAAPNESSFQKMSFGTRMICFAVFFIVGIVLTSIGSSYISKNIGAFLGLYIVGVVLAFLSSMFLKGFKKQFKNMFARDMWYVTTVLIVSTLVTAIVGGCTMNTWATIVPYIVSLVFLIWYMLSLIPACNACIQKICCGCCKKGSSGSRSGDGASLLSKA